MKRNILFLTLAVLAMAACSSLPKATAENDTLLVGQFNFVNALSRNKEVNGTFKSGITLTFRCVSDDRLLKVITQKDGWFFLAVPNEGLYELSEMFYQRTSVDGYTTYSFFPRLEKCFVVKKGKVNNLGILTERYQDRGSGLEYPQKNSTGYTTIKSAFKENFAKADWNNVEWVNTNLSLEPSNIDSKHFVKDLIADPKDHTRFDWLWIEWNNIANSQVKAYLSPQDGETAEAWARRNLELMPNTKISVLASSIAAIDGEEREVPAILQSDTKIISNYLLFNFKTADGKTYDTIMLAW